MGQGRDIGFSAHRFISAGFSPDQADVFMEFANALKNPGEQKESGGTKISMDLPDGVGRQKLPPDLNEDGTHVGLASGQNIHAPGGRFDRATNEVDGELGLAVEGEAYLRTGIMRDGEVLQNMHIQGDLTVDGETNIQQTPDDGALRGRLQCLHATCYDSGGGQSFTNTAVYAPVNFDTLDYNNGSESDIVLVNNSGLVVAKKSVYLVTYKVVAYATAGSYPNNFLAGIYTSPDNSTYTRIPASAGKASVSAVNERVTLSGSIIWQMTDNNQYVSLRCLVDIGATWVTSSTLGLEPMMTITELTPTLQEEEEEVAP